MSDEERRLETMAEGAEEVAVEFDDGDEIETLELPETLPVLPLKNTVLFPALMSPLLVNTERSKRVIDAVLVTPERMMLAVAVRGELDGSPTPSDLYRSGTVMRVVRMLKFSDDSYRLVVQGVARAEIREYVSEAPYLRARVEALEEYGDVESVEATALARTVRDEFASHVAENARLSDDLQALAHGTEEVSALADLVGSHLKIDVSAKQRLLEQLDVVDRLRIVEQELRRARDEIRIESEIREKVQTDIGKTQREYILRQQLDQIRKELGETEDQDAEVARFRERIEASGMPEEAHKQATRELSRLSETPSAAAEYGVIRTYLEWMTDLPWQKQSEDVLDLDAAARILDEDHWGLEKIKERILEYIAVLSLKRDLKSPILCFVGPPGTGKTSLGRSIARALSREFCRVSLGGVRDEAEIRGHRRTYVGAMPGRIVQNLRRAGTRNPVFLLDEVDKVGADYRGDPSSALLEVLDPEQNATFSDHYLEVPFDLSQVLFVATANTLDPIPPALRDRMEIIELPGYTEEDKLEIARRFLIPRQRRDNGVAEVALEIPDETVRALIHHYTREAGVRNLERELGALCRKTARQVAEAETPPDAIVIRPEDLATWLGPVRYESELADRAGKPGVAVGLAYTPVGGDILFIESTRMPGKGELKLTGSLGDVMRESAEAARSWLRTRAPDLGVSETPFESNDLHIHVPSGAIPKDGPSAGVAMVTSLASLLTGRAAPSDVAMTGEITLRGKVLPVGGIKEKLLAAKRAGIRRVLLPERNLRDVEEIPEPLLDGLDLEYVGTIDQVLTRTLLPESA